MRIREWLTENTPVAGTVLTLEQEQGTTVLIIGDIATCDLTDYAYANDSEVLDAKLPSPPTETTTVFDPFVGKSMLVSNVLIDRLRGRYALGPTMENGEPEFGYRTFEVPPIQKEAATYIEQLEQVIRDVISQRYSEASEA